MHNPRSVDRALVLARGLEMEIYGKVVDRERNRPFTSSGCNNKGGAHLTAFIRPKVEKKSRDVAQTLIVCHKKPTWGSLHVADKPTQVQHLMCNRHQRRT